MSSSEFNPDSLRAIADTCQPDPRNLFFHTIDSGRFRPHDISDYHSRIVALVLDESVPREVAVQFETSKNLYLYAWFVYRFFPVAEHHSLVSLELALKTRYSADLKQGFGKSKRFGLKGLLRHAIGRGDVTNEGFSDWHADARIRARQRQSLEQLEEMRATGVTEMAFDYDDVTVTDADRDWGYVDKLVEILPNIRNRYSHGSSDLDNQVFTTIQIASEIINQIYRKA